MSAPRRGPAHVLALAVLLSAAAFGACSDDAGTSGGAGAAGGSGGAGGAGAAGGAGGAGGGPTCMDTQADPENCGACGNRCAPGQTCQAGACTCGSGAATFAADVQPIFTQSCALSLCHDAELPKAGLDLTPGAAFGSLSGASSTICPNDRPLVVPGQPSESYLVDKLLGTDLCSGNRMPPAAPIAGSEIETIASWICAGALDD